MIFFRTRKVWKPLLYLAFYFIWFLTGWDKKVFKEKFCWHPNFMFSGLLTNFKFILRRMSVLPWNKIKLSCVPTNMHTKYKSDALHCSVAVKKVKVKNRGLIIITHTSNLYINVTITIHTPFVLTGTFSSISRLNYRTKLFGKWPNHFKSETVL